MEIRAAMEPSKTVARPGHETSATPRWRIEPDGAEMHKLLSIIAIPFLAAACAAPGTSGVASPAPLSSPTGSSPGTYAVETGTNKLILQEREGGGFVAPQSQLANMPTFALYGDGRIIVPGPVDAIYPGPLLPNLRASYVTPAEIQKILAAADAAGLLGPDASYDATGVADLGTTTFTVVVEGKVHTISAYALSADFKSGNPAVDTARARLIAFGDDLANLPGFLGRDVPDQAYEPLAMRVFVGPAEMTSTGITPQVVEWPLALDPATAGQPAAVANLRCIALTGTDLTTFLAAARTANSATIWMAASGRYSVTVRPLYPEESGCPSTAG
jgi:hypothetical protein